MFIFLAFFSLAASHERWNTTHTHTHTHTHTRAPNPLLPRTRDIAQARLEHQDQLISTLSETVGGKTREIADLHVSEHTKHAHATRLPSHQQQHNHFLFCAPRMCRIHPRARCDAPLHAHADEAACESNRDCDIGWLIGFVLVCCSPDRALLATLGSHLRLCRSYLASLHPQQELDAAQRREEDLAVKLKACMTELEKMKVRKCDVRSLCLHACICWSVPLHCEAPVLVCWSVGQCLSTVKRPCWSVGLLVSASHCEAPVLVCWSVGQCLPL
jgi:hypothetical protein